MRREGYKKRGRDEKRGVVGEMRKGDRRDKERQGRDDRRGDKERGEGEGQEK